MLEEEYTLDYFRSEGFERKICKSCGSAFWTRDPEQEFCGDAPCVTFKVSIRPGTRDRRIRIFLSVLQ